MLTIIGLVLLAIILIVAMIWLACRMGEGGILDFIICYEALKAVGHFFVMVLVALVNAISDRE